MEIDLSKQEKDIKTSSENLLGLYPMADMSWRGLFSPCWNQAILVQKVGGAYKGVVDRNASCYSNN
jgi:hypothetical protein